MIPGVLLHRYWIYENIAKSICMFYDFITSIFRNNILFDVGFDLILELQALGCDFLNMTCAKLVQDS